VSIKDDTKYEGRMRIGIDLRSLQTASQNRGIGTYTRCLIKSLLSTDKDNEYVFFVFKNMPLPSLLKGGALKDIRVREIIQRIKYLVWLPGQIGLPNIIKEERLDIFHSFEHMVPVFSSVKKIITVHDFIYNDYEVYKKINGLLRNIFFYLRDKSLKYADKIIAVSEYTKRKIMDLLKIKEDKIKVIYEAAGETFVPLMDNVSFLELKKKYNIWKDFLLYVGVIDHHKNIHGLIKAFSQVGFKEIDLVLVGPEINDDKGYFKSIKILIEKFKLKNRVHILVYVPQEDLVALYNMAKAVISVSFYDGFGLPILEAMACGKPVIASGNTSMREIVDSSGILVNPYSLEEIIYAIENLLSDEELRNLLSRKALLRAREFSWEKAARETLLLYEDLLR